MKNLIRVTAICFVGVSSFFSDSALSDNSPTVMPSPDAAIDLLLPIAELKRDEFESKANFAEKLCAKTKAALRSRDGLLQIVSALSYQSYNAEKSRFEIDVASNVGDSPAGINTLLSLYAVKTHASQAYRATNAFGIEKTVTVEENWRLRLVLPGKPNDGFFDYYAYLQAKPAQARDLKGKLDFIIFGTLSSPCMYSSSRKQYPTLSEPQETLNHFIDLKLGNDARWEIWQKNGQKLAAGKFIKRN